MLDTHSLAVPENFQAAVHLLKKRTPIPVRAKGIGGDVGGHFARSLLFEVTRAYAVIKPPKHTRTENVPLERIHLWPSAICCGPNPVCTLDEFRELVPYHRKDEEEASTSILQLDEDILNRWVIIDRGYVQFYLGPRQTSTRDCNPFTTNVGKAKHYEAHEVGGANKSIGKIKASEKLSTMVSETGLEVITVREAIEFLRKTHGDKLANDQLRSLDLTAFAATEEAELAARESAKAAGIPTLDVQGVRAAFTEELTTSHTPSNGNGHAGANGTGQLNRMKGLLNTDLPNFSPRSSRQMDDFLSISALGIDVTTDMAKIPSKDEAKRKLLIAIQQEDEAMTMLIDARKERAEALRIYTIASDTDPNEAVVRYFLNRLEQAANEVRQATAAGTTPASVVPAVSG